jgi:hypothetical protein
MHVLPSFLLTVVLLCAQLTLLEHEYDLAAHKSGDTCVTCLHVTPLSHGMVGGALFMFSLPSHDTAFLPLALQAFRGFVSAYCARAPPVPSFA